MSGTRYNRGGRYAADMAVYLRELSEQNTNTKTLGRLKTNLLVAIRQELSEKQRVYLTLYYGNNLNMSQIAQRQGVDKSTVSRTIKRGEAHLRRCLRFGAANLLEEAGVSVPYHAVQNLAKREKLENVSPSA